LNNGSDPAKELIKLAEKNDITGPAFKALSLGICEEHVSDTGYGHRLANYAVAFFLGDPFGFALGAGPWRLVDRAQLQLFRSVPVQDGLFVGPGVRKSAPELPSVAGAGRRLVTECIVAGPPSAQIGKR